MRSLVCSLILVLGLLCSASAQSPRPTVTPRPSAAPITARPQFRPAVLRSGPESLVNRIDTKSLIAKGQKYGAVQFIAMVSPSGDVTQAWTYHPMPDCALLQAEVQKQLDDGKFTPPLYEHQPVGVLVFGTVTFNPDAKPYLHIFLNQDPKELEKGNDFISPQPVIGGDSGFTGLHLPPQIPVAVTGVVECRLQVDAKGALRDLNVTGEDPPLLGFRDAVVDDLKDAKFIPAFRDGDASESDAVIAVCYKPIVMEGELEQ